MINETTLREAFRKSIGRSDNDRMMPVGNGWFAWFTIEPDEDNDKRVMCTATVWNDNSGLMLREFGTFYFKKNWKRIWKYEFEWAVNNLTHDLVNEYRYRFWPKKPSTSIREWYKTACPSDPLGDDLKDVPFYQYLVDVAREGDYYVDGVDDSIVRCRLQAALDHVMDGNGNDLFNLWRD